MVKRNIYLLIVIIAFSLFLTGCGSGLSGLFASATPTPNMTATKKAEEKSHTQTAEAVTATFAAEATTTEIFIGTATAEYEMTKTAEVMLRKTETAHDMYQRVLGYFDEGFLESTEGKYFLIDSSYRASQSKINTAFQYDTVYSADDFVLSADITYDSASSTPDWEFSGCGFSFRYKSSENFYIAFLALNGNFTFWRWLDGGGVDLGKGYYGKIDIPKGTAHLDIVAQGSNFHLFVNGKHVYSRVDTSFSGGKIQYLLISGTDEGYGIRCIWENVELWELE